MLTEESINKLRALVDAQPEPTRSELRTALEDVGRVIGTQALLVRNMGRELVTAGVNETMFAGIVQSNTLQTMLKGLMPPKRNSFTMDDAKQASEELVAKVNSATDFETILNGVVKVAKVFI